MIKNILRIVYTKYKPVFQDLLVEDLLLDIPNKINDTAIPALAEKRESVVKWLYWQAHCLHRRDPVDLGGAEKKFGMLVQIKMWITLFKTKSSSSKEEKTEHPTMGTLEQTPKIKELKNNLDGVSKFIEPKKVVENKIIDTVAE